MKYFSLFLLSMLSIMLFVGCDHMDENLNGENNETTESLQLYYVKNDTEGMDMITDNANYMLFISTDSLTLRKTIMGGRMDTMSEEWIEESVFVIYTDSLNRVSTILMKDLICNFYNYTETTCDIALINSDNTYESVENFSLHQSRVISRETKSSSDEEFIDATLRVIEGLKATLEAAVSIFEKKPDKWKIALNVCDVLNVPLSGGIKVVSSSVIGALEATILKAKPDLFSIYTAWIEFGRTLSESLTEELIGNWKIEIISLDQIDAKTAEITFAVSGIKEDPSFDLSGSVWYINIDERDANNIRFDLGNRFYRISLPLDSYGEFSGRVTLTGELGCAKSEQFKFTAYNLDVSKYEIEENPLYENDAVNFKMNVSLKGGEESLKDVQQFGYYIKYANTIDYKAVKDISSVFESTPLTYELSIPRDGFSDETTDYTKFEAKPSIDYYIGAYVVLKNGNPVHFDEQPIEGLVYNTRPSIGYVSANVTGTSFISSHTLEDGTVVNKYNTAYDYEAYVNGSFWIKDVCSVCSGSYTYVETGSQVASWGWRPQSDGKFNSKSGVNFWDNKLEPCTVSMQLILGDGSTRKSDNSLYVVVNTTHSSISVTGSKSLQQNVMIDSLNNIENHVTETIQCAK